MLNVLDLIVIAVLIYFIYMGYAKGLVITVFNFLSFLISIFLTNLLYPVVSGMLRSNVGFYEFIKKIVKEKLPLDKMLEGVGKTAELQLINSLKLPDFLKQPLLENNNAEIYKALKVTNLSDYVAGFITTLVISIIAMLIVFIIVFIGLRIISRSLDIVTRLPVINMFNKTGGTIAGLLQGIIVLWLVAAISTLFITSPDYQWLREMVQDSVFAKYFYENNFILDTLMSF